MIIYETFELKFKLLNYFKFNINKRILKTHK